MSIASTSLLLYKRRQLEDVHSKEIEINHTQKSKKKKNTKMARVPCKHLLLVAFFLIFFISTTARARNMPVAKETQKIHDAQVLTATEDHGAPNINVDELVSMDYTPPTRKPPIHN
ncbi:hypothetical protein CRYUN_Cryun24cG0028900 [Craigia yunnanensis]